MEKRYQIIIRENEDGNITEKSYDCDGFVADIVHRDGEDCVYADMVFERVSLIDMMLMIENSDKLKQAYELLAVMKLSGLMSKDDGKGEDA